ncbi:rhodanese-like domain-containing protein [Spongiimicrobium salis]|uniref:rhodanese-like domain-containing protein n=1 Tax=Spongiimicrobium salis TaxID=1667022 RepID=UPI00374D53B9
MRKACFIFIMILGFSCKPQSNSKTTVIDLEAFKAAVIGKDVQLIDVRTSQEYNAGHIDNALHMDISNLEQFAQKSEKLNKNKPVYIYCQAGVRSHRASKQLEKMGFISIFDFKGGYSAWKKQ